MENPMVRLCTRVEDWKMRHFAKLGDFRPKISQITWFSSKYRRFWRKTGDRCTIGWSMSVEKKTCTLYFCTRNRFLGSFSVFEGRVREISKWVKWLTLKGYKWVLAGVGDVLMAKFISHIVVPWLGFRFFRAPRGRLHPQFGRFVNVDLIFEGERRLLVEIEIFTEVVDVDEGYILCENHGQRSKCRGVVPGGVMQNFGHSLW